MPPSGVAVVNAFSLPHLPPMTPPILEHGWIIVGFIRTKINPNYTGAMEYLQRAPDMINWGRGQWPTMHKDQRGAVFTRTFRKGVWNLLLNATMEAAYSDSPGKRSLLNKVSVHADGLLKDLENKTPDPGEEQTLDPGFVWSSGDNNIILFFNFFLLYTSLAR
ncbi:hypothetical protein D9758_014233 [Tetrapyrgos nigripes]|uniref:Uncharacterized protein n=1 Tax=Tetrapyrgos nigripes TaxID=182062 RepID=A0A8H5CVY9_9AGAR|nr:hypothetical protein D9758_014233 [Tetrapyrgos nigripes]